MSNPFDSIRSLVPKRSRRLLSDYRQMDFDIGQLIPICSRELVPGDNLKIGVNSLVRAQPLISPTMGELSLYTYYFFVPYRILDPNFEDGITGGEDGSVNYAFPHLNIEYLGCPVGQNHSYSLADYFGLPQVQSNGQVPNVDLGICSYNFAAYHKVWNEYFRVEEFMEKIDTSLSRYSTNQNINELNKILNVSWSRDYFTSALKSQQKGVAPSFPVQGMLPLVNSGNTLPVLRSELVNSRPQMYIRPLPEGANYISAGVLSSNTGDSSTTYSSAPNAWSTSNDSALYTDLSNVYANLSNGTTFDVAELRTVVQIQKILERANRTGSRYTEYLRSFFSVSPRDERLQRPEFIGGAKVPIIVNEVLQTNSTTSSASSGDTMTPQGTMSGHGISLGQNFIGKYFAQEYGVLLGVMFLRPKTLYSQGINREWLKSNRYDFYLPQLCNLSEQGIYNKELFVPNSYSGDFSKVDDILGFQGRWNEKRSGTSLVTGSMRDTFAYWHFGRFFDEQPNLDKDFLECKPEETKKIFAVQSVPGFIGRISTNIDITRPLTAYPEPGRLDHDM